MVTEQSLHDDLETLLVDVIDNKASEADFEALVAALRTSDSLRRRACVFLCDESLLSDEVGTKLRASKLMEILSNSPAEQAQLAQGRKVHAATRSLPLSTLSYINHHGLAIAAMAALVVVGLFAHNMLMMAKVSRLHALVVQGDSQGKVEIVVDEQGNTHEGSRDRVLGDVVGRVIGLNDVRWRPGARQLTYGDSLDEGQAVRLDAGGLEILLTNGAKITAAGPADFKLSSLFKMDLDKGKIVAAVPRTARGYTIMTPTSELIDVGTQFGVSVADSGETELHVFDGDVFARSRVSATSADFIHYKENEAIRFDSESPELKRFAAQESGFLRRLAPAISAHELPELPRVKDLCLWYAADMIRDVRVGDPVSVWRDILIGDNQFANDARQFDSERYPRLAMDVRGYKSLSFNGTSTSLQIDPIDYSGGYSIFIACTPGPTTFANELQGGILFKHGESPSLELSVLADPPYVRSWVWPGPGQSNVGIVKSRPLAESKVSLIACQYDSKVSRTQLWVDGESQQQADAPVELRPCAQAFLGSHGDLDISAYFFGNIYEVVIYDGTVDAGSMSEISAYFKHRYLIDQLSL